MSIIYFFEIFFNSLFIFLLIYATIYTVITMKKNFIDLLLNGLEKEYPDAKCALNTENPLQLLISTQLSAQCKDDRVNIVTKELYKKYKTVFDFADADIKDIENIIKSLGLYRNKAKNMIACCKKIVSDFGGEVPKTMEELLTLDGTGRKTANLVLGDAFGIPGIVVDTHMIRLSNRLGLTKSQNPVKIEFELKEIIPSEKQTKFCHQMVLHGRKYCTAANPKCSICPLNDFCPKTGVQTK